MLMSSLCSNDIFKGVFRLAIRLLALIFIFHGLRGLDVPVFTDVVILKGDDLNDVISALLPVGLNLTLGWWLLGSSFLSRRAYPEAPRISGRAAPTNAPMAPAPDIGPLPEENEMGAAEKKLAALVAKTKKDHPAP